ncbi:MAG TPA: hypothetical protein RMH99_17400 [Sandaracinaceae bacterium LLY-WYZ-13_1]|nr:hypothetical protein [Sandaracinaceae bacterium LLY-WYZ-13_1]
MEEPVYEYEAVHYPWAGRPMDLLSIACIALSVLAVWVFVGVMRLGVIGLLGGSVLGVLGGLVLGSGMVWLASALSRRGALVARIEGTRLSAEAPGEAPVEIELREPHVALVGARVVDDDPFRSAWTLHLRQGDAVVQLVVPTHVPPAALRDSGLPPIVAAPWMDAALEHDAAGARIRCPEGFAHALARALVRHRDVDGFERARAELALAGDPAPRVEAVIDVARGDGAPAPGGVYREGVPTPRDGARFLDWLERQPGRALPGEARLTRDHLAVPRGDAVRVFPLGPSTATLVPPRVTVSGPAPDGGTREATLELGDDALAGALAARVLGARQR